MNKEAPVLFDESVRLEADLEYLGSDRAEKLDVYLPPESFEGPRPAVLLIHGGGWRMLDKGMAREKNIGYTLASHGYAVFSINYLLNEETCDPTTGEIVDEKVAWPQNLYDCKTALRWIRLNASRFNVDTARIATMGGSAGGHLSMMVGCTADSESLNQGGLYLEQSNEVKCVINLYGLHEIRDPWTKAFAGSTPEETAANVQAASPVSYLDSFPPILILHGSADETVSVEYSRDLAAKLEERDLPYWYFEIGGAGHSFHLQPEQMDLRPLVLQFLRENLD
ncbi:alpha/beta hydrolase [Cerasicoccus maritimus]|uniref:alpha/beta hydrolase n=1 Tax=Cerasicoccus maritimus TaxID=490089 RepID=UPI0028526240|nr:alpha/beta hydrolase [Cerasicoccus maritimus]